MPYVDPATPNREFPYSRLERVVEQSEEVFGDAALYLLDGVQVGVYDAIRGASQMAIAFAEALYEVTQSSKDQLQRLHFEVARGAQLATHAAYMVARSGGRMSGPYRLSQRDAGGRLERAILDPEFIRATYDGIGFANTEVLDRMARQWHRLNFGAGAAAGTGPRSFQVHWGRAVISAFGYTDTPSAPFVLPPGSWFEPGTGKRVKFGASRSDWFHPGGGGRGAVQTKGIRAWQFLDAGLGFIAENIGPAYEALYRDWYESAKRGVGPLSRVETVVPPPRPARFRVTP